MTQFSDSNNTNNTKSSSAGSSNGDEKVLRTAFRARKVDGETCRRVLDEFGLLEHGCKPFADDIFLYLPLVRYPEKEERLAINQRFEYLLDSVAKPSDKTTFAMPYNKDVFFETQKKAPTVYDLLGYSVAYEIIGDIAVLDDKISDESDSLPSELGSNSELSSNSDFSSNSGSVSAKNISAVADAILTAHPAVKTVLLSKGPISGEFRTRDLEFIAGVNKTETIHKEYGCKYKVDLARAYFTPRLSTERHRIVVQIKEEDVVIDMFAGVGPYSILIAKHAKPAQVIANDKNEAAVELLKENIALNKVENVIALNEDALFLAEKYKGAGDHVIMNLPHNAYDFLDTAVSICKSGGVIHYYAMTSDDDLFDGSIALIQEAAEKQSRSIKVLEKRNVRSYAPHQYNICLDVQILNQSSRS
ncbi:class I SAM-dependent methyltransferase family protein [Methanimicrococcus sp. OttesenSCG-928-J09]|nr:class I SAM-dependent methyltransferase family protein [Methanimicrococcus sp. OttesenSCG-928-J09]